MHEPIRLYYLASEMLANTLMSETDAEQWYAAGEGTDEFKAMASLVG